MKIDSISVLARRPFEILKFVSLSDALPNTEAFNEQRSYIERADEISI